MTRRESRPGGNEAASRSTATDFPQHSGVAAWKRRHAGRQRVVPLDCGCRDLWPCRCTEPPLSARMIDAGRDAAQHILDGGDVPLLELEVLQALWRRGGADRAFAERLHELTGGAIA